MGVASHRCSKFTAATTHIVPLLEQGALASSARVLVGLVGGLVDYLVPGFVGVEFGDGARVLAGFGAQVFLDDDAVLIDHERHHAGRAILGRIGDEGEAVGHLAVHDVALRTAGSVPALLIEDSIVVAVKGRRGSILTALVTFDSRARDERTDRAFRLAWRRCPIEPVLLARVAQDLFGELIFARGVFILPIDEIAQHFDREDLVAADSPEEQLIFCGRRVEDPSAIFLDQWNRRRPVLGADDKRDLALIVVGVAMHLVVFGDEIVAAVVVRDRVARRDDLIGVRAEYRAERFHVIGLGCGDQRAPGGFGRWKHLLLDVVGRGEGHDQKKAASRTWRDGSAISRGRW